MTEVLTEQEVTTGQTLAIQPAPPKKPLLARLSGGLLSVTGLIAVVVVWQALTMVFDVPQYLLPAPSRIGQSLFNEWDIYQYNLVPTVIEAIGGFIIGNGVAFIMAFAFTRSQTIENTFLPFAVALRSTPIVAITPLITLMLGRGYVTTITIAAMICFFPTLVNTLKGLRSVNMQALEMMRVLAAGEWDLFWKIRFPTSLPYVFSALRITATASVLGAMVAEWLAADRGLGFLILDASFRVRIPLVWGGIVITTTLAVLAFTLVGFIENKVIPWHESVRAEE
ncbi:MAG: ABC transporter permease [Chloroflexi bacterium]|nr:ABC transporter permease [Chloroflexota bacterium]MCL5074092.1 ABC transporter permease [Chloroflexota bacterium]